MRAIPRFEVFAVESTAAQVIWRDLAPGRLTLSPSGAPPCTIEVQPGHTVGAVTLENIQPGRTTTITASGPAVGSSREFSVTTAPTLPGAELARVSTVGDLHVGIRAFGYRHTIVEDPAPEVPHPIRCTTAALEEAVKWGAGRVVAKGDLTNSGQIHQWRELSDMLSSVPVPVLAVPGNHDRAFRSGLSPEDAARGFGLTIASPLLVSDGPGHRLVLVDSTVGAHNRGRIAELTGQVLEAVAEVDRTTAVLVFLHHQFHRHVVQEGWPVGIGRGESTSFLRALAATGRRVTVSSGHTHRHRHWSYQGVVTTQVGSTKDYPGVWAGYVIAEGGIRQVVRRVEQADCISWTEHTRRAAAGLWRWLAPGSLDSRCFDRVWNDDRH